jgi:hypothetical protein
LPRALVRKLEKQTLATIIRRHTPIAGELQSDVFLMPNDK